MNAYQQLAAELVSVRRLATSRKGLRHSSLEDGSIPEYDRSGVLSSIWGRQWDDAHGMLSVNGPTPPTPGGFTFRTVPGALMVEWLGEWDPAVVNDQPVVAPSDFSRVEIHASTAGDLSALLRDTLKSTIETPRGAEVRIDLNYGEAYYVRAIARATTGKISAATPVFGPFTIPKAVAADLDIDEITGNTIFYGAVTPTTTRTGDLWLKWVNSPTLPAQYETYRWDGDSWEKLLDQGATAAALAAEAAQTAANLKVRLYSQDAAPTGLTLTDKAIWQDTNDGNKSYLWDGDSWEPRLIGNAAIQPASLVASDVIATGTVTAALLEALLVIANIIVAGDPNGEHTRIDSTGVANYAVVDGLPVELGRQGRGWSVRDPITGNVVAATTDSGIGTYAGLSVLEPNDFLVGGLTLWDYLNSLPKGMVAYGKYPITGGNSTLTNTEIGFLELSFIAEEGRSYAIFMEGLQPVNATSTGAWVWRLRYTTDGSTPTTASQRHKEYNTDGSVDVGWNQMQNNYCLMHGPSGGVGNKEYRLLFSYAAGTGSAASQGAAIFRSPHNIYAWVQDMGPTIPETGDEVSGSSGGATTKTNRVYESAAAWQRTWNQSGSVIAETEMQQGYGDSFNGIRRAAAGWSFGTTFSGATIQEVAIDLESYHWWNMSGGTARVGYHANTTEPASFPAHTSPVDLNFSARVQNKWFVVPWAAQILNGTFKGISMLAPSTATTYYGKFRGEGYGSGRPRLRVKYTK